MAFFERKPDKIAFSSHKILIRVTCILYGLKNAAAPLNRVVEVLTKKAKGSLYSFFDKVSVFLKTPDGHIDHMHQY